jgi:5-formyltetrahydrofolate cyclo-ligase
MGNMSTSKTIREKIWTKLKDVAKPDSRFHMNFAEVIPGFEGDDAAVARVRALPAYRDARHLFVTPDNCLEALRRFVIEDGKRMIVSTYGIYRGFVLIEPGMVPEGQALFASVARRAGAFRRAISRIAEIARRWAGSTIIVTGASAVSVDGVRFGKGHGFFDLEWGMFTDLGLADERTPVRGRRPRRAGGRGDSLQPSEPHRHSCRHDLRRPRG